MSSPDTVFGMSLETFTLIHVLISLVGIGSGLVVLFGLMAGKRLDAFHLVAAMRFRAERMPLSPSRAK